MASYSGAPGDPKVSLQARVVPLCGLVITCLAAWHAIELDYRGDDASITVRYLQNVLAGHGPVFNAGERVEGYSSFLWLVALSGVARSSSLEIAETARLVGAVCGAASVLLVHRLAIRLHGARFESLLAPLLLAVSTPFATWAKSGLEAPLFAMLVMAAVLARTAARPDLLATGAWLGLCALARPEGILLGVCALGFESIERLRSRDPKASWRHFAPLARLALPLIVLVVPHLIWRRVYYGEWLPNTYFAKVDLSSGVMLRGLGYLAHYLGLVSVLPPLLALLGGLAALREARLAYPAMFAALYGAWIVVVGGDGLVMYRFVAHVLPLLCLLQAAGAIASIEGLRRAFGRAAPRRRLSASATGLAFGTALGLLSGLLMLCAGWPSALLLARPTWPWLHDAASDLSFPDARNHGYRWFDQYFSERVARAGRFLDLHANPNELVAANAAGIGAHLRQPVLDMLGLNDKSIARRPSKGIVGRAGHERGDGAYVLARKPAYVLLGNVALLPQPLDDQAVERLLYSRSERELWALPAFHQDYERVVLEVSPYPPYRFFTFYRRRDAAFRPGEGRAH